ncbi:MAG: hypothetical protein J0H78_20340 [Rhizobiales bacterium]|nr:hypothetical protein [Hyphomicrobiales bacterium]OJY46666.1 MAG: hypothetical protein BGP08_16765 [Rhizobiales bacterium 64-17]
MWDDDGEDTPALADTVEVRTVSRGVDRDSRRQPVELDESELLLDHALLRVHDDEEDRLLCEQLACAACTCAGGALAGAGVQDRCGIIA